MRHVLPLICLAFAATVHAAEQKPNVLFIPIDDLNAWVSCLALAPDEDANIDRLAKRGCSSRAPSRRPCLQPLARRAHERQATRRRAFITTTRPGGADPQEHPDHGGAFQEERLSRPCGGKIYHGSKTLEGRWDDYYHPHGNPVPKKKCQRPNRG